MASRSAEAALLWILIKNAQFLVLPKTFKLGPVGLEPKASPDHMMHWRLSAVISWGSWTWLLKIQIYWIQIPLFNICNFGKENELSLVLVWAEIVDCHPPHWIRAWLLVNCLVEELKNDHRFLFKYNLFCFIDSGNKITLY